MWMKRPASVLEGIEAVLLEAVEEVLMVRPHTVLHWTDRSHVSPKNTWLRVVVPGRRRHWSRGTRNRTHREAGILPRNIGGASHAKYAQRITSRANVQVAATHDSAPNRMRLGRVQKSVPTASCQRTNSRRGRKLPV
eukprot:3417435-Prymnesium_polylepis.3